MPGNWLFGFQAAHLQAHVIFHVCHACVHVCAVTLAQGSANFLPACRQAKSLFEQCAYWYRVLSGARSAWQQTKSSWSSKRHRHPQLLQGMHHLHPKVILAVTQPHQSRAPQRNSPQTWPLLLYWLKMQLLPTYPSLPWPLSAEHVSLHTMGPPLPQGGKTQPQHCPMPVPRLLRYIPAYIKPVVLVGLTVMHKTGCSGKTRLILHTPSSP